MRKSSNRLGYALSEPVPVGDRWRPACEGVSKPREEILKESKTRHSKKSGLLAVKQGGTAGNQPLVPGNLMMLPDGRFSYYLNREAYS